MIDGSMIWNFVNSMPKVYRGSPLVAFHTGRSNFLLPQRKEGRKEQGLKMGERKSPKSEGDTGVSDLGAFKLDHLQPVELILFQTISTFLPFILGGPISYYPIERKEGRKEQGLKNRKRESPKSE